MTQLYSTRAVRWGFVLGVVLVGTVTLLRDGAAARGVAVLGDLLLGGLAAALMTALLGALAAHAAWLLLIPAVGLVAHGGTLLAEQISGWLETAVWVAQPLGAALRWPATGWLGALLDALSVGAACLASGLVLLAAGVHHSHRAHRRRLAEAARTSAARA